MNVMHQQLPMGSWFNTNLMQNRMYTGGYTVTDATKDDYLPWLYLIRL